MNIITEHQAVQAIQEGAKYRTKYAISGGEYDIFSVSMSSVDKAMKYVTKAQDGNANKYITMAALVLYGAKHCDPLRIVNDWAPDDAKELITKVYNEYTNHYDNDGNKIK